MSGKLMDVSMKEIREELYGRLVDSYDFQRVSKFRIAGNLHGVAKDNIEVIALDFSQALAGVYERVEVSINIPVKAREDKYFTIHRCAGRDFLSQKEEIVIRNAQEIQEKIGLIVDLTQRGSAILQLCGKPPYEYLK
jgi:hypothetical protein